MVKKPTRRDRFVSTVTILLTAFVLAHFPWRLAALGIEALAMNPGPTRISQDTDQYWSALELEGKLIDMGWKVKYKKDLNYDGNAAYGLTSPADHLILIDEDMKWNARFAVLAHEAGHVLQPGWADGPQREVFAEAVAALVTRDGLREHARYLSRHKKDVVLMFLLEWGSIYHAATLLEDR